MILKVVLCSLCHNQNIRNIVNSRVLIWKNVENTCEKENHKKTHCNLWKNINTHI